MKSLIFISIFALAASRPDGYNLSGPRGGGSTHGSAGASPATITRGIPTGTASIPGASSGSAVRHGGSSGAALGRGSSSGTVSIPGASSGSSGAAFGRGSASGTASIPGASSGSSGAAFGRGSASGTASIPGASSGSSGAAFGRGSASGTASIPGASSVSSGAASGRGTASGTTISRGTSSGISSGSRSTSGSASQGPCGGGQVRHVDGRCVTPRVNRRVFVYDVPSNVQASGPVNIPEPLVETNILLIRSPEGGLGPQPVVIPPPRQNHVVYVLNKQSGQDQRVIEVPSSGPTTPEVYFVNYAEGENPTLPSGVDLQSVLQQASQGAVQDIGSGQSISTAGQNVDLGGSFVSQASGSGISSGSFGGQVAELTGHSGSFGGQVIGSAGRSDSGVSVIGQPVNEGLTSHSSFSSGQATGQEISSGSFGGQVIELTGQSGSLGGHAIGSGSSDISSGQVTGSVSQAVSAGGPSFAIQSSGLYGQP